MAATAITPVKLTMNAFNDYPTTAALDATDGGLITWNGADERSLVIIENTSASAAASVTIKGGDGIQSANDLTLSIPASTNKLVTLESGAYMQTTGTNKGKVKITGPAAAKVAVVIL